MECSSESTSSLPAATSTMAIPVKKYIEQDLGINTEREQAYWDEWDKAALRRIIQQQRKITDTSWSSSMILRTLSCTSRTGPWTRCSSAAGTCRSAPGQLPEAAFERGCSCQYWGGPSARPQIWSGFWTQFWGPPAQCVSPGVSAK